MKKTLLLLFLLFNTLLHAQTWQWGKSGGSVSTPPDNNERVISMSTDPMGNVTVVSLVGSSGIQIDGNPKSGYSVSYPSSDIAIASFSCDGTYRWSKTIGSFSNDYVQVVDTDSDGNVYVAGTVHPGYTSIFGNNYVHFDTDTILPATEESINQYKKSMFLVKYDSLGNFKWLQMPQPDNATTFNMGNQQSRNLQVDPEGNCYWLCNLIGGNYADGQYTVNGEVTTQHILKYNAEGDFIGGHELDMQSPDMNEYRMIRNHQNGHYIIAGGIDFDGGYTVTVGGQAIDKTKYVATFDSTGAFLWLRTSMGDAPFEVQDYDVACDSENNIYLTGTTLFTSSQEPYVVDGFNGQQFSIPPGFAPFPYLIKLDSNGNTLWQTNGDGSRGKGITINGDEVAISGYGRSFNWQTINFQYPGDVPPFSGLFPSVIRFNKNTGTIIANHYLTSAGATFDDAKRITSDNKGNYFIGGSFQYQLNIAGTTLTNLGGSNDFFLAKLGSDDCDFLGSNHFKNKILHFYPNPVRNHLFIDVEAKFDYEIYSILGSRVLSGNLLPSGSIYVSGLEKGMYLVRLSNEKGNIQTFKIIKE